ncbi:hypothetical protein SAMN05518865_11197 [Duganella sp. CF458]|uniref:hypothetical protein n=1 Tax=Duganella sp. CF458 TaxID=1884368 RepID=UPI0008EBF00A|nr:hypothetical protein [Duganella sp. CF458]SFG36603.1 hypothetical protein SAMN05518865_11197 [Duganella sp. CF458]
MKLIAPMCGLALALAFSLPLFAAAQVPPAYRATALPFDSAKLVINNAGDVAGTAGGRVALWRRGTGLAYLTGSGEQAYLGDMNDVGQLVGSSDAHPTIWQLGRQPVTFEAGRYGGAALAINNQGTIVAMARAVPGEQGPRDEYFIYKDGQRNWLHGLLPWAINEQEQVVGTLRGATQDAAVWQGGIYHELPDQGYSLARDINDKGWAAGGTSSEITTVYGAIWKGDQLETYGLGYANAINNAGVAVGYWEGARHAMMYSGGRTYDLNTLWDNSGWDGWSLFFAEDINDAGEIVVIASNEANFAQQVLLLSPVPETATAAMLLAGLALLGGLHRAIARNAIAPMRTI